MLIKVDFLEDFDDTRSDVSIEDFLKELEDSNFFQKQETDTIQGLDVDTSISGFERFVETKAQTIIKREDPYRLVSRLCIYKERNDIKRSMYTVYERFFEWSRESDFESCDAFINLIEQEEFDIRVMMSILMASRPFKKRLSNRSHLYNTVQERARVVYDDETLKRILLPLL